MPPLTQSNPVKARKVFFVNRFYAPDLSATSQILTDIAEALAQQGLQVTVLTARMSYDGKSRYAKSDIIRSVNVQRIWTTRFGRNTIMGRACDYLTFYMMIFLALLFTLPRGSILVAKTDPPMLSIPMGIIAKIKRAKLVNWLQDVFPEVAQALGVRPAGGALFWILKKLRDRSLQKSCLNVVIGENMAGKLLALGVSPQNVRTIPNFVNDQQITPSKSHAPSLRKTWNIAPDDFIVGYSGNLGRAHDLDTMLGAAEILDDHPKIKFLFVGAGFLHERLHDEIEKRQLSNILLRPYQPRNRLSESLSLPNLHWASLNPKLEGYIVPSKIYGVAAAGRPLLMIGDSGGEIGRLMDKHRFGYCVSPGNRVDATQRIIELYENPVLRTDLGERARRFIDEEASIKAAKDKWHSMLCGMTRCT